MTRKEKKKLKKYLPVLLLVGGGAVAYAISRSRSTNQDEGGEDPGGEDPGAQDHGLPLANLPRGLSNNNPLNIKLTSISWLGKVPKNQNTDGTFEQFFELSNGYKATITNLLAYKNLGYNTLRKIIEHWAPYDAGNYLTYVSTQSGLAPDEILTDNVYNKAKNLWGIVRPMAIFENGVGYTAQVESTWDSFLKGFQS